MSFFTGKGEAIQSGGYQTSNLMGIDTAKILFGTDHNLGVVYEVVLNLERRDSEKPPSTDQLSASNSDESCLLSVRHHLSPETLYLQNLSP